MKNTLRGEHLLHIGYIGSLMFKPTNLQDHSSKLFQQENYLFSSTSTYPTLDPLPLVIVSMLFTCIDKIKEVIICDGILHVNMFHYYRTPYIICTFFAKFIYNEYIRPYFYRMLFLRFFPVTFSRNT